MAFQHRTTLLLLLWASLLHLSFSRLPSVSRLVHPKSTSMRTLGEYFPGDFGAGRADQAVTKDASSIKAVRQTRAGGIVNKPKHKGKALVAGALAGVFEICCTYPTEYVKTTMQLSTKKMTVNDVIKSTFSSSGPIGFYRGLPSMVYFAAPKAAIRFASFETCSSLLSGPNGEDKFGLGQLKGFLAGLGAGTMEAIFVTTPQETIKVRLINDAFRTDGPAKYKGFFHGVRSIVNEFGLAGCYKGVVPTIFKVSTAQATRFGVFQCIPAENRNTPVKAAAAGAFSGGVSVLLFQGIDVVKSRMQGLEAHKYKSTLHCVRELLKNEGPMAFYKGVGPRLTRVCLEVGITMALYGEIVKMLDTVWKTDP